MPPLKSGTQQTAQHSFRGFAIPEGWDLAADGFCVEELVEVGPEGFDGGEFVAAEGDGDGAFGVRAKSEAGGAEVSGFFLEAAGIGEDEPGVLGETEGIVIADGFEDGEVRVFVEGGAGLREHLAGARMHREDDRNAGGEFAEQFHDRVQVFRSVDVRRAMERDVDEVFLFEFVPGEDGAGTGLGKIFDKRIDHDIADKLDLGGGNTFAEEVFIAVGRRGEKQVGETIGDQAIDFLGHGAVEAAEAGFEMGDFDTQLGSHERAPHGGIDVADNDDPVWLFLEADGLERGHDVRGLNGVRTGADREIDVGRRDAEFGEEDVRHFGVVMLPGMNEDGLDLLLGVRLVVTTDRFDERSDLHEIGACAGYDEDFGLHSNKGIYAEVSIEAICWRWAMMLRRAAWLLFEAADLSRRTKRIFSRTS